MVLVTGASGFVGRHLVKYLSSKGERIRALYHSTEPNDELKALPGVEWMKADLLDIFDVEAAMKGIDKIYHCAAVVSFHPKQRETMLHFNKESTANIVDEALEQGVKKIVHLSSVAAIGRSGEGKEINEETEWQESRHNSMYGISKYFAEMEVWRGAGEGLNAVIVCPGIILGEGNWDEGSARLMKVVYKEFPFYTQGVNSWVDVKDVVDIMYRLMQSDVNAERFIISNGNHAYKDVFTMMAKALNKKPPHISANKFTTGLVWRFSMLKNALSGETSTITKETAANAQRKNFYNNTKLGKYLPDFAYTPLQETVTRMAGAFLREKGEN